MDFLTGRHFLQIPGPTNVPDRVLRALAKPTIDHRGPGFSQLALEVLGGLAGLQDFGVNSDFSFFRDQHLGSGFSQHPLPGDRILMVETGHFATLWHDIAVRFGLDIDFIPTDWRHGADPGVIEEKLSQDRKHMIKAVAIVHNETSTGVTSRIAEIRKAIDQASHPALFLVDTISSLASIDYRHDEWGVDVMVGCSQKGLMLPPGLGINAISAKALAASKISRLPKSYWEWDPMLSTNKAGFFPYTPSTNLLYGLQESLKMLQEEGLEKVFARHDRHAEATRRAVRAWKLELLCCNPEEYSSSLTAVLMPAGHNADAFRKVVLEKFNMSLGNGLNKVAGKVFRIGHLGNFNDLMLAGTLSGVEMGLGLAGVPYTKGGVMSALEYLAQK